MTLPFAAPHHILIAEDDAPIAGVLAALVADLGYHPLLAADGQRALDLAQATWPVLVLSDLMMPRLSGAELIAALRTVAAATGQAPPPVILLTAAGLQHTPGAGAAAVLSKPFDLDELERLIALLLAGPRGGTR